MYVHAYMSELSIFLEQWRGKSGEVTKSSSVNYRQLWVKTSLGPTSVNISEESLPQDMVLLLGVTVEAAEGGKLLLGEVGVPHGRQTLTEPGHADGPRSERVKVFKVFRHLYMYVHICAIVVWGWGGEGVGVIREWYHTDRHTYVQQLPHTVQTYNTVQLA